MRKFFGALLTGGLLATMPLTAATERPPLSAAAGWATAYLVNAALIAEYEAVLAALPTAPTARAAALISPAGIALWQRTAFVLASLEAKSQLLPELAKARAAHAAHGELLIRKGPGDRKSHPPEPPAIAAADLQALDRSLTRAAQSDLAPEADDGARPGHQAMAATFASEVMRERWTRLTRAYGLPSPTCPIDVNDVRAFAAHQKSLLSGGRAASAEALLKPIAGWELAKVQCLVFALMASTAEAKEREGYEPVPLLRTLQQGGSPMGRDVSLKALTAVRLMQLSRYAETLSLIMDLTDLDEAFRLPYESVQRAYSLRQKGEGAVALQGL